jgi:prevent-host-death family protein
MNYAKATEPLSSLKTRSAELIRHAKETGQPVILTRKGRPAAILQDVETYQRQREALILLRLAMQGERDYRRGDVLSDAEADEHFRKKLEELGSRA